MSMHCDNCKSDRILSVSGKVSDSCYLQFEDETYEGYVPGKLNIGSDDYLDMEICMDCGKVQGKYPIDVKFN
jgi:hypothetical protein